MPLSVLPKPSNLSLFAALLQECVESNSLQNGLLLHTHLLKSGSLSHTFLSNRLIQSYFKLGAVSSAGAMFDEMPDRDSFTWNIMITGSVKSRNVEDARRFFEASPWKNEISWESIIKGYVREGNGSEALSVYARMVWDGWSPTQFSVSSVLQACGSRLWLRIGKQLHCHVYRFGLDGNVFSCTALVDMYCKCRQLDDARRTFDGMRERNVVSWNAILSGYSQNFLGEDCFQMFVGFLKSGLRPDHITFAVTLSSIAGTANWVLGKELHGFIVKTESGSNVFVETALIDVYAKCGSLDDARRVFDTMSERNAVTWSSIIVAYAQNGYGREAIALFEEMKSFGIKPDAITFVGVLMACSHSGLVNEGRRYFESMRSVHRIEPDKTHYTSLVDLLGRAGHLGEAEELINTMPVKPDAAIWGALLGACRVHRNLELGKLAASKVFELESQNPSAHMLLCHIYTAHGQWDEAAKMRKEMKILGVKKDPGCSWVEVDNAIHSFVADDNSHPRMEEIIVVLKQLIERIEENGYVSHLNPFFSHREEEGKNSYHSEKLAVVFGLMSTPSEKVIRIMKNLRVCNDCHSTIKFISEISGREIIVRDVCRFHHFKTGRCSCGDYW